MDRISLLKRIKEAVKSKYQHSELILYGSRARGENNDHSDWDILILLQDMITKSGKEELLNILYDLELEYEEVLSPIIHSRSDWDNLSNTPLHEIIEHEGLKI